MNNKQIWSDTFKQWLPLAVVIVIFSGLVYAVVQQNYRQSANDPQIQVAQDIATAIGQGTPADGIVPPNPTAPMSPSLATFVAIYSATGTPIGSSVSLDGKLPTLPQGVFNTVKLKGDDRFTWQPDPGVRIAAVVEPYTSGQTTGYILAGRSLKEIEIRENALELMTGIAMLLALLLSYLVAFLVATMSAKGQGQKVEEIVVEKTEINIM